MKLRVASPMRSPLLPLGKEDAGETGILESTI
jgi:hypothetical protein